MKVTSRGKTDELIPLIRCDASNKNYTFENKGLSERYREVLGFFKTITERVGCNGYSFILSLTKLVERFGKDICESAREVLDNFKYKKVTGLEIYPEITEDAAFAAFYYVALFEARFGSKDGLKAVLSEYYKFFSDDYVNMYELFARYCSRNKDYERVLYFAELAEKKLKKLEREENVALGITYAAAIVSIAEYCFFHRCIYKNGEKRKKTEPIDGVGKTIAEIAFDRIGPYVYDASYLSEGVFDIALNKIEKAIEFNPEYPKYPYLKAQVIFYASFYRTNVLTRETQLEVLKLIGEAKSLLSESNKNYLSLIEQYNRFEYISKKCPINSDRWNETEGYLFEAAKSNIIRSSDPKQVQPAIYKKETKSPYVFVSYSSRDFKSVYCDMIEYKRVGILCDYDNDMTSYGQTSDVEKQKWYNAVEEKIRNASCVLCYLSENYVVSKPSLLELKLIEKYKKPFIAIDLGGDYRISGLFMRVAKNPELAARVTSDNLYWFCKKFDDDNNVIARAKDPMVASHIEQVKKRMFSICPEVINVFASDFAFSENRGKNHPMEDSLVCDAEHNVYVVADGITRQDATEYDRKKDNKISHDISNEFCHVFAESFVGETLGMDGSELISEKFRRSFVKANASVKKISDAYLEEMPSAKSEPPGTVAVAAAIYNDVLYFGSVGDCVGVLVRNGQKIIFSDKQTSFAFGKAGIERDRALLQRDYINNPANPYGYGVINGNPNAVKFFKVGHLSLEYGDTVYLVSDGVADYIRYCDYGVYADKTVEEIISAAVELEERLRGKGCSHDDMAVIRIKWTSNPENLIIEKR